MTGTWRIHTYSGSIYEIRRIGREWRLRVPTAPSSPASVDLRDKLVSIIEPTPWPPEKGQSLLFFMEWAPGHWKIRRTSDIVRIERIEGPAPDEPPGGEEDE